MEVLVDQQTKRIVGAALLGIEADEAIHCIIDVMTVGNTPRVPDYLRGPGKPIYNMYCGISTTVT